MRFFRPLAGFVSLAAVLAGCPADEPTPPPTPVPTTVNLSTNAVALDALGATQQLTATVLDQDGQPMSGQTVTWTTDDEAVASVSTAGLVTAEGNGSATVTASVGSVSNQATVNVAQVPTQIAKIAGDAQSGVVAAVLALALEIEIRDSRGNAVPGGTPNTVVTFAVASGGGSVSGTPGFADANGRATTMWTLGTGAGAQGVTASIGAGSISTQFAATGTAGPADEIVLVSGDAQSRQIGAALPDPLVVRVDDEHGNPVSGHMVTFAVTGGGGSVDPATVATAANGEASTSWTLGMTVGNQTAEAQAATAITGSPVAFSANGTNPIPSTVVAFDGDGQTGLVGLDVNVPPAVIVRDQTNDPFVGASVTFMVQSGGGSVSGGTTVTDANGIARVAGWTLGGSVGANTLNATVTGTGISGNPVSFSATGATAGFDIVVRYFGATTPSASQQAAFAAAEATWESIIFSELTDIPLNQAMGTGCGAQEPDLPVINETVDDIVIFAKVAAIDGVGGVLGRAGPCIVRSASGHPVLGRMVFDDADLDDLEASGGLNRVILHEMAHVFGFGTLWNLAGFTLLAGPCPSPTGCTTDPHFVGARSIAAFDAVGGSGYAAGEKVPAENCVSTPGPCGDGTVNGHWRESVLGLELMTGYLISGVANPLSILSAASFLDMNYLVAYANAESFVLPGPPAGVGATEMINLTDDIARGPILVVDGAGRVVRVIRR